MLPRLLACLLVFGAGSTAAAADTPNLAELFRTGQYAACVEAATPAIAANQFIESHRLLKLRSELELGRYTEAAETFEVALKTFPSSIELRWWGREVVGFGCAGRSCSCCPRAPRPRRWTSRTADACRWRDARP
ncbi:MAG: hypothetical protein V4719_12730, partial [Planctomycetota bacterium]